MILWWILLLYVCGLQDAGGFCGDLSVGCVCLQIAGDCVVILSVMLVCSADAGGFCVGSLCMCVFCRRW